MGRLPHACWRPRGHRALAACKITGALEDEWSRWTVFAHVLNAPSRLTHVKLIDKHVHRAAATLCGIDACREPAESRDVATALTRPCPRSQVCCTRHGLPAINNAVV